jgi:hypothetical protein
MRSSNTEISMLKRTCHFQRCRSTLNFTLNEGRLDMPRLLPSLLTTEMSMDREYYADSKRDDTPPDP